MIVYIMVGFGLLAVSVIVAWLIEQYIEWRDSR